ncbi:hypothetical protein L0337_29485 [candidate division KSB1 bacterium]|nr:hypothetical protein [candidate division KSB1 bacterium]
MPEIIPFQRATNITETYYAVNPEQPLQPGDPRYVDLAPWRGSEHVVNMIAQRIIRTEGAKPTQHLKQLLAGHRGCGKSTELLLLKDRLEREDYFVVHYDAALEIDMNDTDYADLLLATMRQLELQVRQSPLELKLDASRLDDLAMRLALVTIEKEDRNEVETALETEFRVEPQIPFKAPPCHIIYTVPISIYFNENLTKVYPDLPLMIPMIKVWEENGRICKGGLDTLHQVITQRVDVAVMFEDGKGVDKLCLASGGHIRDLLLLARYACDYSAERITPAAVDKAISALIRQYDRLVKDADLPRLIKVHREKRLPGDPEYSFLPYHLIVLEYQNGERWADLHPAVQETRKFREAWDNESSKARKKKTAKGSRQTKR